MPFFNFLSIQKNFEFFRFLCLTFSDSFVILSNVVGQNTNWFAGIAQPVEQLICNQQVGGSNPSTSSKLNTEEFPSGQRGQTVNLLRFASVVRIHPPPPKRRKFACDVFLSFDKRKAQEGLFL